MDRPSDHHSPSPSHVGKMAAGKRRIVVAAGSREAAAVVRRALEGFDAVVLYEAEGLRAVDACLRTLPTLLILDVALPDISGWQVVERIRQAEPGAPSLRIVVLTSLSDPATRLMSRLQGVHQFLTAPPHPDRLRSAVAAILAGDS